MIVIEKEIERLLQFAVKNGLIDELDIILCRNGLMDLLKVREPYKEKIEEEVADEPAEILNNILDYAVEQGIIEYDTTTYRDLFDAKIMGILMPRESEVVKKFREIYMKKGAREATEYFYNLSKCSNYIRMDRIKKNLYWQCSTEYGELEITINLSKPEKDPKDIALAKSVPTVNYPKCLLCLENVGFAGNTNHPARQNHRVIPMKLGEEQWFLQYSPYVYYNEHCILFKEEHVPMSINEKTFERLFNFVKQIPHYFMGSNADLPIVGGSILTHEHFQGGNHAFPMEKSKINIALKNNNYPNVKAGIVNWPMSVIRLTSEDIKSLIGLSNEILSLWRNYSDEEVDILAYSYKNGERISHNTITPIVRKTKDEEFQIDLVLRNNRTSDKYPDGIFHPHKELHHIKKENIGLIEVMGLAVLPGRLYKELKEIEDILSGKIHYNNDLIKHNNELLKHKDWIEELIEKYGSNCSELEAKRYIQQEVGEKFSQVLKDAGVYKSDKAGRKAFIKFMNKLDFEVI
ncbi:Galactose-1-phosphate uridylyltransferase [Clostridium liquoris]|jgi:UDPglucose--hexose-1-phosphate uridylyltransferase|uniref:Galactose-1-phosphate uridylyltransferase n=1 Tax=Clostridium liquoris TaxID=1289519 RepID=A0A2T0B628_9CLOT|nr:UDP-glucose--hexose-1-phosphate uridylyltransferase [Clostridium liquoris]PRR79335.1 Galactose-1-phosphate uridylyltransferase [Clostridium liquoris]